MGISKIDNNNCNSVSIVLKFKPHIIRQLLKNLSLYSHNVATIFAFFLRDIIPAKRPEEALERSNFSRDFF